MAKFTTRKDLEAHIEDGMGSDGSLEQADLLTTLLIMEGFFELEWDGYYSTLKWDNLKDEEFIELWEKACGGM